MKNFYADYLTVIRFVLKRHMLSPATWVILAGSLVVVNAITFFVGDVWGSNDATMGLFWGYFPFVMAVLAPLLAMRSIAYERQMGTYDWLITKPLRPLAIDGALFDSQMILFSIWLVASLVLPATFAIIANPDGLTIAAGYLGAVLLGGVFGGGAFMAASRARTMVGAFMGGFLVCMALLFTASEGLATLFPFALPTEVSAAVMALSPLHAFERLQSGFVLWADILLLLSIQTSFFLIGHGLRQWQMFRKGNKNTVFVLVTALVGVIALSQVFVTQGFDLTEENRYKPSQSALKVVESVPTERMTIQFYYSLTSQALTSDQRAYGRQVMYYLQTLARLSDKVRFSMLDPTHSAKVEQMARRQNIEPTLSSDGTRIYMGLVISTKEGSVVIPTLPMQRRDVFEFDLMNNIVRLRHDQTRRILIVTGMNMADKKQRPEFLEKLAPFYRVDINNFKNAVIPDENDLVIVLNGYYLEENTLYALDQYVQRGGKVLAFVDPFWFAAPAGSMQALGPDDGVTAKAGFDDLLTHWGLTYIPGRLVADPSLGTPIQVTDSAGVATHPLWLTLKSGEINQKLPLSRGLNKISVAAAGFFDLKPEDGTQIEPILKTSPAAHWLKRSNVFEANLENMDKFFEDQPQTYTMAAKVTGAFDAFYKERPQGAADWLAAEKNWPFHYDHIGTKGKPTSVIAVADMDFFSQQLSLRGEGMSPNNDNLNLLFNMVRDLLDEPEALQIKLRYEANRRPFVGIESHLTKVAARFSDKEKVQIAQLMDVRRELADLRHKKSLQRFEDPGLEDKINQLDFKELQIMHRIDDSREAAFKTARRFIGAMTMLIALGGGVLLLLFGFGYRRCHRRAVRRKVRALSQNM